MSTKDVDKFVSQLEEAFGFTAAVNGKGHIALFDAEGNYVSSLSSTPSDRRWRKNAVTQMKRAGVITGDPAQVMQGRKIAAQGKAKVMENAAKRRETGEKLVESPKQKVSRERSMDQNKRNSDAIRPLVEQLVRDQYWGFQGTRRMAEDIVAYGVEHGMQTRYNSPHRTRVPNDDATNWMHSIARLRGGHTLGRKAYELLDAFVMDKLTEPDVPIESDSQPSQDEGVIWASPDALDAASDPLVRAEQALDEANKALTEAVGPLPYLTAVPVDTSHGMADELSQKLAGPTPAPEGAWDLIVRMVRSHSTAEELQHTIEDVIGWQLVTK